VRHRHFLESDRDNFFHPTCNGCGQAQELTDIA
jgi:hypothetical protein